MDQRRFTFEEAFGYSFSFPAEPMTGVMDVSFLDDNAFGEYLLASASIADRKLHAAIEQGDGYLIERVAIHAVMHTVEEKVFHGQFEDIESGSLEDASWQMVAHHALKNLISRGYVMTPQFSETWFGPRDSQ